MNACGAVVCRLLQMPEECETETLQQHVLSGLGFLSMGNVSILKGASTIFEGPLNHTGLGLINMVEGAVALFTGDYSDRVVDFMKGGADMVDHVVSAMGMTSAGNITFDYAVVTFDGPLVSDGTTANLKSRNATVRFASNVLDECLTGSAMNVEGATGGFGQRRLLAAEDGSAMTPASTYHFVGGLGMESMGNISVVAGADTTFVGSLNHSGTGRIDVTSGARVLFAGLYADLIDWMQGDHGLTKHVVSGLGMTSGGNTSFELCKATFDAAFISDGPYALVDSSNASVEFGSGTLEKCINDLLAVLPEDGEAAGQNTRRLLQVDNECKAMNDAVKHLLGGRGFISMGNVTITPGAATTFQGPLNHTGTGLVKLGADAQATFTGDYSGMGL